MEKGQGQRPWSASKQRKDFFFEKKKAKSALPLRA
jgi:hypothetical protein